MIAEVAQAIMQKYNGNAVLKNALSGGLHFQRAPQDQSKPYGVFFIDGIDREEIMGGADDNITHVDIQISVFSDDDTGGQLIAELAGAVTSCFHWQGIILEGYLYLKMQEVQVDPILYVDEIWQANLMYELWMQKQ